MLARQRQRLRRTMLFVPGDNERMLANALRVEADSLVLDLETSVVSNAKSDAREIVRHFMMQERPKTKEMAIRINSLKTEYGRADISMIVLAKPDTLIIPRAETSAEVREVDKLLSQFEAERGLPIGDIKLMPRVESPLGVINVEDIATSSPRNNGIMFGAGTFYHEMCGQAMEDRQELYYALSKIVLAARVANIDAIDSPYVDVRNLEGCREHARQARILGYDGKSCIHPGQVKTVNEVFTPTLEEIKHAKRVIQAYEQAEAEGKGASQLDGKLIERVDWAASKRVLETAEMAGVGNK